MAVKGRGLVIGPGDGRSSRGVSGAPTLIKITGDQSDGLMAVFEQTTEVGSGPPLHIHHECAELLYVLEGDYTFKFGEEEVQAVSGTLVFVPKGLPHTYVNSGVRPARLLFWCAPAAGMAAYIGALGNLPAGPPDMNVLRRIALEHGVEIVDDKHRQ